MEEIRQHLFNLRDEEYARFQAKLTPTVAQQLFIGVRVPVLRKYAKQLSVSEQAAAFIRELPHRYYDENMLHGLLINTIRDYEKCLECVDAFLPYVDNWAVCDTLAPGIFKKHKPELLAKIREWSASRDTYTCRFGMKMLMTHFLDEDFQPEYLELPARVDAGWHVVPEQTDVGRHAVPEQTDVDRHVVPANSDEYYIRMMVAWFYATALAKQWDATLPYLEQRQLSRWTHNKTIQKAIESYRITDQQKEYLRTLKRK